MSNEYGGYANLETWIMAKAILTDNKLLSLAKEHARETTPSKLAADLQDFARVAKPTGLYGPFMEFIEYSLSKVAWLEIANKVFSLNYKELKENLTTVKF